METGQPVVATVGNRQITKVQYEDLLASVERKFVPDTLGMAGRREFLDHVIDKELMVLKAEDRGYGETEQFTASVVALRAVLLPKMAAEKHVEGKLEVTSNEIERFYERTKFDIYVKHILLSTRGEADSLLGALKKDADFDSLAAVHSEDSTVEFGRVSYGTYLPWTEAAFECELGEVSAPVQTLYGWHLFMPVWRDSLPQVALTNEMRKTIESEIRIRRRAELLEAYYESILAEHNFQLHEDALNLAFSRLPEDVPPGDAPDPADEIKPILYFTPLELGMVLFEVDGEQYTLRDFSDRYDGVNWFERPKRNRGAQGIRFWMRDFWLKRLRVERARSEGIDTLPEFTGEVRRRREEWIVNMLYNDMVTLRLPEPTQRQIETFYAGHGDLYKRGEERLDLGEARDLVIRDLKNTWAEARLTALLEEWRHQYSITVYDDVLADVEVSRDDVYVPGLREQPR